MSKYNGKDNHLSTYELVINLLMIASFVLLIAACVIFKIVIF